MPGTLVLVNTIEAFQTADRGALLGDAATLLWHDVCDGAALRAPSLLSRFVLHVFPDLKAFTFRYWFSFPALQPTTPVTAGPVIALDSLGECAGLLAACSAWLEGPQRQSAWLLQAPSGSDTAVAHPLSSWPALCQSDSLLLAFADPCPLLTNLGWPLRNLLVQACALGVKGPVRILALRASGSKLDARQCVVIDAVLPAAGEEARWLKTDAGGQPLGVGWERDAHGQLAPRLADMRLALDPQERAAQAVDLNLKLMRWRLFPELDAEKLARTRCLLIGAGTLGCAVARTLLGWGVRDIVLVDNGTVSFSNPVRQSLFEFEDCLDGRPKAQAAAQRLQRIFPGARTRGVSLTVPMPGHPVLPGEEAAVLRDVEQLEGLVAAADCVFLLTDTRESRWLPTLLCAHLDKLAINAALGFDSFLVMRHGSRSEAAAAGLGCYFCTDVVAAADSTAHRSLDQQCTVTRPGLAPIAAALAVELAISVLHHPEGAAAGADASGPLGDLPHQIRGSLSGFEQRCFHAPAFGQCTACSSRVLASLRQSAEQRSAFLLSAFQSGAALEELTGLTQLHSEANKGGWDDEEPEE